jgi:hypothetical protein
MPEIGEGPAQQQTAQPGEIHRQPAPGYPGGHRLRQYGQRHRDADEDDGVHQRDVATPAEAA